MNASKPLEDMTYKVIGAAMSVHNALGPGLKEAAYHRALSLEMERAELSFEAEKAVTICATGTQVGLLLNFGRKRLEYKRIFPPKNVGRYRERINRYLATPRETVSVNPLGIR
jgi:hypothetical protein